MAFTDENTSVIRMKRDFDQFLQDSHYRQGPSSFSLDKAEQKNNVSSDEPALSVQALLAKNQESKLKAAEVIAAKSEILKLESKINSLETSHKRARIEFDKELKTEQEKEAHAQKELNKVKLQLKFLSEKEDMVRQELTESRKELEAQRKSYDTKLLNLQKEILQLSDKLQQEKEKSWEKISELKHEMLRSQTELKMCQCELEETKQQLEIQVRRSSDISSQVKEHQEYRLKSLESEQKIKNLELQISRMEEESTIGRTMKSQLLTFKEMEKENRKLKDENQYLRDIQENNMLLKEQNEGMTKKLSRLEERMDEFAKLQMENEEIKSRLQKWEEAEKGAPTLSSPTQLSIRIAELQNYQAIMLSKQGSLQSSLHSKERTVKELQEQLENLTSQMNLEKAKSQQKAELVKRLQRKVLLATKERDGYKNLVTSYESGEGPGEANKRNRIQQLEENCQGYKKQAEFLEGQLNASTQELTSTRHQIKQLEFQLSDLQKSCQSHRASTDNNDQQLVLHLREKIATLEKSLEKCETEKFALECRIEQRHLQGDYDPTKVKVLHFEMNPAAIAQTQRKAELNNLRDENERLRQRVKLLEESEGKMEDLTVAVEKKLQEPGSSKDIEEMKAQLTSAELKNKRLMEAFKETSQEFREMCYQLTGYQIDIPTSKQYKLTSMYSESPNDYLLFKRSSSGELQMLGTEFSSSVQDLISLYLQQQNSVPAFTSSVTLELHSRQTVNCG